MHRFFIIILALLISTAGGVYSQVAYENTPVPPTNYARALYAAVHPDSATIRLSGDSDSDSSGVYFHDPFTVVFLHVTGDDDSVNVPVGVKGGITQGSSSLGFADTSKFYFTETAVLDTITAPGDYRYTITIEQCQHIYFVFDTLSDNGADTAITGDIVRRKYH